jgi:glycine/D-amino acid oxidase-like deaminating enzyme
MVSSGAAVDGIPAGGGSVAGELGDTGSRRLRSRLGSDDLPRRADAVVVGGGIVGLAAAYELAVQGMKVCLLDRSQAGSAQSTRNWGFIRQQGRSIEELPLMIEATRMWLELDKRLGCDVDFVQGGNLRLTDSPDRAEDYHRWIDMARSLGLDSRVADAAEVEQIMPGFAGRYLMGIFTPSDSQVNPVKAVAAYVRALRALDVEILENYGATSIVTAADQVVGVLTDDGFIGTSTVVLAAGAGSKALLRSVGLEAPIHFVGQTVALTTAVPELTDACVWTGEIGFRQTRSGGILLSSGGLGDVKVDLDSLASLVRPRQLSAAFPMYWKNREYLRVRPRELVGALRSGRKNGLFDDVARYPDVAQALGTLSRYFPQLRCDIEMAWAGTIDGTPDALPILDALDKPNGLVVATGMSGHGFGIAPAVGRVVADLVTSGSSKYDLSPFRLQRFREGKAKAAQHLL